MSAQLLLQTIPLASHDGEGSTWILGVVALVIITCLIAVAVAQYRDPNRKANQEVRRMLMGTGPRRSFVPESEEDGRST
ncbi:hypothetical protein JNUCC0626_13420 [Lentzea sp. JNUCC 0626]|uniref:hypothetical protein n=1 Tax=Lentzea sp. JNUCC 0626 TaxID=3367513 RepID=UPI003749E94C